jgi:hypothetical protein
MSKPTLELLFGYALLAGAVAMVVATARTARRGWIVDEDGETQRREDAPKLWRTMQLFQVASVLVLVLTGLGVLGLLGW